MSTKHGGVLSYFQSLDTTQLDTTEQDESKTNTSETKSGYNDNKGVIEYYMSNIDDTYVINNEFCINDKCKLCDMRHLV